MTDRSQTIGRYSRSSHLFAFCQERMLSYANLRDEISHIRQMVMLNLFGLVCKELNTEMYTRTDNLRLGLIKFQVRLVIQYLVL